MFCIIFLLYNFSSISSLYFSTLFLYLCLYCLFFYYVISIKIKIRVTLVFQPLQILCRIEKIEEVRIVCVHHFFARLYVTLVKIFYSKTFKQFLFIFNIVIW